jgi:predicted RNA binding protein YcfA (HicA-like mRNA interferase family)
MPSKYPVLPPNDIIRTLAKLGFEKVSQKGSHVKYSNNGNPKKTYIIPMHNEIEKGTLKSILEQAGVTIDEFKELLK